jgi:hypothetical protein
VSPRQRDFAQLYAENSVNAQVIQRLDQARQFISQGVNMAAQAYGHPVANREQILGVIQAYNLEGQMRQHWPDVELEDLFDLMEGGRLTQRVVRDYRSRWFPPAAPEGQNGRPAPSLAPRGLPARAAPAASALALAGKPGTVTRRGGTAPAGDSAMERVLNATVDQLIAEDPRKTAALMDKAIQELETEGA